MMLEALYLSFAREPALRAMQFTIKLLSIRP